MDTLEIIREMRADPALTEEMRAVILDEELRKLPEMVKRLVESTEAFQAATNSFQAAAIGYFGSLEAAIAELVEAQKKTDKQVEANTKAIAELVEAQKKTDKQVEANTKAIEANTKAIAELVEITKAHGERLDRIDGRLANLSGSEYERQVEKSLAGILGYAGSGFRRVRTVDMSDLVDKLDAAVEEGRISAKEAAGVAVANHVATARAKDTGREVYLVMESSITADEDDVRRARDRAAVVARALGVETCAVVVSSILPGTVDYDGVLPVYFAGKPYRLAGTHLPDNPVRSQ